MNQLRAALLAAALVPLAPGTAPAQQTPAPPPVAAPAAYGTPEEEKKHVIFEGGHVAPRLQPIIREILDWLDRTQGQVSLAN